MVTYVSQCYPIQKVIQIVATVLDYIWEVITFPTHSYNFSHEGKKEGKVGLAYEVKTNF